jgi:DNA-binding PadR family transcriptional regulator
MFGPGTHLHDLHDFKRRDRMVERGDFKYLILDLLNDKPAHGYEVIRALEERFHGFYSPSPGSVYPTLQMLEDLSYVTSGEQGGKKIYTMTDEGKKYLEEQKDCVDHIKFRRADFWNVADRREIRDIVHELRGLGQTIVQRARDLNSDQWASIRDVVQKASREIEDIIKG